MRPIMAGVTSLKQYLTLLNEDREKLRPDCCPFCGIAGRMNFHDTYYRKADYESLEGESLNPIPILRFICMQCRVTCSVLPECIPPNRHYPWSIQQAVIQLLLDGFSANGASESTRPSRWTIRRWFRRLESQFKIHADHLRCKIRQLGFCDDFYSFWRICLSKISLSGAMLSLHYSGCPIP